MNRISAGLLALALTAGPASAQLGVNLGSGGLGVQVGPIGANLGTSQGDLNVGANVGSGTNLNVGAGTSGLGVNLGTPVVGAQVGAGAGGVNLGVSGPSSAVAPSAGSPGATPGGTGSGATGGLAGPGAGVASIGASPAGASTVAALPTPGLSSEADGMRRQGGSGVDFAPRVARSASAGPVALPLSLAPSARNVPRVRVLVPGMGDLSARPEEVGALREGLRPRPGTSIDVVQRCRRAAVIGASRYPVARLDAASAGSTYGEGDRLVAPVEFRIVYRSKSATPGEAKQAVARCEMARDGRVLALR